MRVQNPLPRRRYITVHVFGGRSTPHVRFLMLRTRQLNLYSFSFVFGIYFFDAEVKTKLRCLCNKFNLHALSVLAFFDGSCMAPVCMQSLFWVPFFICLNSSEVRVMPAVLSGCGFCCTFIYTIDTIVRGFCCTLLFRGGRLICFVYGSVWIVAIIIRLAFLTMTPNLLVSLKNLSRKPHRSTLRWELTLSWPETLVKAC